MVRRMMIVCCALWLCACGADTNPSDGAWGNASNDGTCNHHVYRHDPNSWLLSSVEMRLVYWGSYWETSPEAGSTLGIWEALFSNEVLARLSQYGIKGGSLDNNLYLNNPNTSITGSDGGTTSQNPDGGMVLLDDTGIPTEINNEIQTGKLPPPNDSTMYMIMLPPGVSTSKLVQIKATGYHGSASSYAGARYTYGVITYQPETVGMDVLISHELYEAATNPDGHGWYDDKTNSEVGDFCQGLTIAVGNFAVQKVWDDLACECL